MTDKTIAIKGLIHGEVCMGTYGLVELALIDIEKDIDTFAMGFLEYVEKLSPSERVSVWAKDGSSKGVFTMDSEQLLKKYKRDLFIKQKGAQ